MSVLIIGENETKAIAAALELARDQALPFSIGQRIMVEHTAELKLKDRRHDNPFPRSQHLMLGTYHCAISFEEQPVGLCRHLSVSVRQPGKVPTPLAMKMIAEAFGFKMVPDEEFELINGRTWLEEFEPGHHAVNVIQLEPTDNPKLYDVAREVTHEVGMPWTDPRTGITHQPPKKGDAS